MIESIPSQSSYMVEDEPSEVPQAIDEFIQIFLNDSDEVFEVVPMYHELSTKTIFLFFESLFDVSL